MSVSEAYPERVLTLFQTTPGAGRGEAGVWYIGEAREPLSATHVRVHLQVDGGRISAVRYEVRGCPYTVAATALVAQQWTHGALGAVSLAPRALLGELAAPVTKLGRMLVVQDAYCLALQAARCKA